MSLRRPLRLLRRFLALPRRERRDLWRAQWFILRAQFLLRRQPEGALLANWQRAGEAVQATATPRELQRARAVGDAVRRAGAYGLTHPRCLARSMAITAMLESEGIEGSVIRVGVRPPGPGAAGRPAPFEAHAWVELSGQVVGDSERHVRRFVEFVNARAAPR